MASKPVIMVLGASGMIGTSALTALTAAQYAGKFEIKAGVRDPDKADKIKSLQGISCLVQATMGDEPSLRKALRGVHRLFIVTPPAKDCVDITITTILAASLAGVKHIVVVSIPTADLESTIFGAQFSKIEEAVKKTGVPYTIIRLAIFMENIFAAQMSIKDQSGVFMPLDPTKPYTPVAVSDAGKAAAAILASPAKHAGKTYNLVSCRHTFDELCAVFSSHLGREIHYVRVTYDVARKSLVDDGFQEWQADGLLELYKMIDSGSHDTNLSDLTHYRTITGQSPVSLDDWIAGVKGEFQ